jgi:hypothetical protein
MPVVTVLAASHPDAAALIAGVADAVATSLALQPGDVIATFVASGPTVAIGPDRPTIAWPIVTIHGSDRGREKMESARAAAEQAVREWSERQGVALEGVWTQWQLPMPA